MPAPDRAPVEPVTPLARLARVAAVWPLVAAAPTTPAPPPAVTEANGLAAGAGLRLASSLAAEVTSRPVAVPVVLSSVAGADSCSCSAGDLVVTALPDEVGSMTFISAWGVSPKVGSASMTT